MSAPTSWLPSNIVRPPCRQTGRRTKAPNGVRARRGKGNGMMKPRQPAWLAGGLLFLSRNFCSGAVEFCILHPNDKQDYDYCKLRAVQRACATNLSVARRDLRFESHIGFAPIASQNGGFAQGACSVADSYGDEQRFDLSWPPCLSALRKFS